MPGPPGPIGGRGEGGNGGRLWNPFGDGPRLTSAEPGPEPGPRKPGSPFSGKGGPPGGPYPEMRLAPRGGGTNKPESLGGWST